MRKEPYTARGIKRVACFRCTQPSTYQWKICADGGHYRGICAPCDIGLNAVVLAYLGDPNRAAKMKRYKARVARNEV